MRGLPFTWNPRVRFWEGGGSFERKSQNGGDSHSSQAVLRSPYCAPPHSHCICCSWANQPTASRVPAHAPGSVPSSDIAVVGGRSGGCPDPGEWWLAGGCAAPLIGIHGCTSKVLGSAGPRGNLRWEGTNVAARIRPCHRHMPSSQQTGWAIIHMPGAIGEIIGHL